MKTVSILSLGSILLLVALRLAGITTEIQSLDRWVTMLMSWLGLR